MLKILKNAVKLMMIQDSKQLGQSLSFLIALWLRKTLLAHLRFLSNTQVEFWSRKLVKHSNIEYSQTPNKNSLLTEWLGLRTLNSLGSDIYSSRPLSSLSYQITDLSASHKLWTHKDKQSRFVIIFTKINLQ